MEKLIDLLSRGAKNDDWCLVRIEGNVRKFDERLIISKSYGFIKRLVDNDKIDHKIYEDMKFTAIKQGILIDKKSGSTEQETRKKNIMSMNGKGYRFIKKQMS